jgi:ATP-dependent exoDNAse (exonuclease V) beta subunit
LTQLTCAATHSTISGLLADATVRAALAGEDQVRVNRVLAALDQYHAEARRAPLARRVEAAWLRLGGPASCARDADLLDAQRYLEALGALEDGGEWRGPSDLDWLVEGLYAASDAATADAVQIMTIHRSKGLEFDCVILPGLGRKPRADAEPLLDWFEWPGSDAQEELLLAPVRSPEAQERSPLGAWIAACRKRRRERERARVLYVATTRARSALHLIGSLPLDADGVATAPPRSSPLGTLWPAIEARFPASAATREPISHDSAGGATGPRPLRRFSLDWQAPTPPADVGFDALQVSTVEAAELPTYVWVSETARHVGTVVHAQFERYVRERRLPTAADLAADAANLEQLLSGEGVEPGELPAARRRVLEALARALEDPVGRWVLGAHAAENHVELELTGLYGGRLTSVIIDRCFVDEQGMRWVIDYKTSSHEGGGVEEFTANESERYRPQLQRYAALARGLGPQPVRAALYFPLLARLVEVRIDA